MGTIAEQEPLILLFGEGRISVWNYTAEEEGVTYGVGFTLWEEEHGIGTENDTCVGKTLEEHPAILRMEFSRSASVQVVIDYFTEVRDGLRQWEERQKETEIES